MFRTGETRRLRIVSVSLQYAVMRNDDEISKTILRIPLYQLKNYSSSSDS
jgi:hypothetical protein